MVLTATFEKLLLFIGVTLSLSSLLTVAGLIRLRRRFPSPLTYQTLGYPFTPLIFILGNLWIILYFWHANPWVALASGLSLLVGFGLYGLFKTCLPTPRTSSCRSLPD